MLLLQNCCKFTFYLLFFNAKINAAGMKHEAYIPGTQMILEMEAKVFIEKNKQVYDRLTVWVTENRETIFCNSRWHPAV